MDTDVITIECSRSQMKLLEKASAVIPVDQLWINPDCGLKTRHWDETKKSLNRNGRCRKRNAGCC